MGGSWWYPPLVVIAAVVALAALAPPSALNLPQANLTGRISNVLLTKRLWRNRCR
jgi:hypothetical protein